jgi:polyketide biosynthesis enoyl-CoA hydratase PksI
VSPSAAFDVHWEAQGPVARIRMTDRANRNRMSPGLRDGLAQAIEELASISDTRAILLEGLPEVFSAGATEQALLSDRHAGLAPCREMMRAIACCPVPVIAAAQGHAIGGGLLLALIADFAIFSMRSRYGLNFVRYGFTPVLGSRVLLSARLGPVLAAEMLYTGAAYAGRDLARRAPSMLVAEHDSIPREAQHLARQVARAPRRTVELLKRQHAVPLWDAVSRGDLAEYPDHVATHDREAVLTHVHALRRSSRIGDGHA